MQPLNEPPSTEFVPGPLQWTKQLPTVAGFYWLRNKYKPEGAPCEVWEPYSEFAATYFAIGTEISGQTNDEPDNEWYGPIYPPGNPP